MFSSLRNRIIAVVLLFVIFFGLGFRLGHPQDGLKNALGSAKSGVVSGAGGVASTEGPSCSKRSKSGKPTPDVSTKRSPVRPPTIAATGSDVPVAAGPAAAATSAGASSSKKSGTASAFSSEKSGGDVYYTVGPLFASAAPATSIGKAAKQKSPKPLWPLPVKGDQRWA
jgi:hypothetical protein